MYFNQPPALLLSGYPVFFLFPLPPLLRPSLFNSILSHTRVNFIKYIYLPTFLPSCLPYRPAFPTVLPSLPSCLPYLPILLPSYLPTFPTFLPSYKILATCSLSLSQYKTCLSLSLSTTRLTLSLSTKHLSLSLAIHRT